MRFGETLRTRRLLGGRNGTNSFATSKARAKAAKEVVKVGQGALIETGPRSQAYVSIAGKSAIESMSV